MFSIIAILCFLPQTMAFFNIMPYVSLTENMYNVSNCSQKATNKVIYNENCVTIYEKTNDFPKCCYELLERVSNTSDFRICYPNGTISTLYDCTSNYDYLENKASFITLSIMGILFLLFISVGLMYYMCSYINRGLFKNRYQPM